MWVSVMWQANQLQQLVREHYDNFVSCADGIHWFKNMIAEESVAAKVGRWKVEGGGGAHDIRMSRNAVLHEVRCKVTLICDRPRT